MLHYATVRSTSITFRWTSLESVEVKAGDVLGIILADLLCGVAGVMEEFDLMTSRRVEVLRYLDYVRQESKVKLMELVHAGLL